MQTGRRGRGAWTPLCPSRVGAIRGLLPQGGTGLGVPKSFVRSFRTWRPAAEGKEEGHGDTWKCPGQQKSSSCVILHIREARHEPRPVRLLCSCGERDTVPCPSGGPATEPPQSETFPASPPTPPTAPTAGAIRSGGRFSARTPPSKEGLPHGRGAGGSPQHSGTHRRIPAELRPLAGTGGELRAAFPAAGAAALG